MFGPGSGAFSGGAGNTSAFGQSAFGKPATPTVFGQSSTSLFNQTTQPNTGLFGSSAATPAAFGQTPTAQPTFGGFNTGGTSLFGGQTTAPASTGGLFGQQNTSMVGNAGGGLFGSTNPNTSFGQPKPSGFSFGAPSTQPTGSIFGTPQTSTANTGLFGASTAGTFGATSGFGATSAGGTTIKFNPVTGTDTMVKNGVNQTINTRHQSITVMKEYESKIFEELRFEDYSANRKVGQQTAVGTGLFGSPKTLFSSTTTTSTSLFGTNDNKQLFGATSTAPALGGFGNTGTSNVFGGHNNIFGKTQQTTPAFGSTQQQPTQSFGIANQPNIFGSTTAQTSKPFGVTAPQPNIFGSTAPSTFGTQPTGFGQQNQNNLFGQNKPAFGSIGATQTTTGFGFGTNTSTSANGLFGSKPTNSGFPITTPSFGMSTPFGSTPSNQPNTGSLFGSSTFKAPTTSIFNQPANQTTGVFNNPAKPGGLFGSGTQGTGLFGSSNSSGYGSGSSTFFGNNQQSSGIGLFGNTNNVQLSTNQGLQNNQMQLQLDALKAMPYGDSPLFKRFYKDVSKVDESSVVRSQSVSLEKFGSYKVSPIPTPKSIPQIRNFPQFNRKSLFDGLEESPPSLKNRDKIGDNTLQLITSPRSGCKKLNLKKDLNECSKLSGNSMIIHSKPLAKLEQYFSNKQDSPEDRSQKVNLSINEENNTIAQLQNYKQIDLNTSKGTEANGTFQNSTSDTDIIDNQEPSIDHSAPEAEDHPSGIKLRRVGYYTIPPMNELAELVDDDGSCFVDGFTIGRYDYGNVYFPDRFNVAGLDLDSIVHIRHREVIIYQDDENKPPLGEGLNRKATVTLDRIWPNDKTSKQPITNPDRIAATNFVAKLQRACAKLNTQFVDYRTDTGSWVFNVEHFSKYALIDSDDDGEENTLEHNLDSKTHPKPVLQKPKIVKPIDNASPKQNVMKPILDLSVGLDRAQSPQQYLLKSNTQVSAVDQITDDSHIMHYYDNNKENSINVTAQLSQHMNLQANKIQCMKASFDDIFYNELEPMEQDEIYEQKDKFEDKLEKILETIPEYIISPKNQDNFSKSKSIITPIDNQVSPKCFIPKQKKKVVSIIEAPTPVLTAPLQSLRFNLKYDSSVRLPFEIELNNTCESSKLALLNSLSVKVSWSNNLTFITLNTKSKGSSLPIKGLDISSLASELSGRRKDDYSSTVVQKIQIMTPVQTETFIELLTEHLEICMKNSNYDTLTDNIPYVFPKSGVDALHRHCYLLAHFSDLPEEESYAHVWELIKALWGDPENLYTKDCPQEHLYNMARRQAVSDWLETLLERTIDFKSTNEKVSQRILKLASVHKIMEACDLAITNNEFNLAMLLAQLGSENSVRCCIQRQLWQWYNSKADLFIDIDHLKLYTMISGQPLFDSNQGIINVCENLDWARAFALHLWYIQPPSGTIGDALNAYQNAFESDDSYACKPYKIYDDSTIDVDDKFATYDVCYHLLKLYTNSAYEMYKIVNPLAHTRDPLDFSFSWLLYNTLQSLGYTQMPEIYANQLHSDFASQLVSHGLWQWAVFVLLHIKDEQLREHLIEDVIGRNVELPRGDTNEIFLSEKEKFVLEKLNIKIEIIYNAKAILAETHKKYFEAVICYLRAEHWQKAHSVLVNHLLADLILKKEGRKTLKLLLSWLIDGITKYGAISTTMHDSLTVLEYLKLNEKLTNHKMSTEKLVAYIASLCDRVASFSENTIEERMIKTELSSSIVHQVGQLLSKFEPENRNTVVQCLNKLTLTEDYALDELVLTVSHNI